MAFGVIHPGSASASALRWSDDSILGVQISKAIRVAATVRTIFQGA